jgi:tetratricopeptide (TPR) repeat protein
MKARLPLMMARGGTAPGAHAARRAQPPRGAWLAFGAGVALAAVGLAAAGAFGQGASEDLMNRVSNPKIQAYEEQLTQRINAELARYIGKNQYALSVKIIWNPDVVPVVQNPALSQDKQKLPGFPIFVRSPDSPQVEDSTPSFTRLTVRVLLDETLPEYYERFVRKLVPIVARFDSQRGDQVIVVKETFPFLNKEQQPPTLPEKELLDKVGAPAPVQPTPAPSGATMAPREAAQIAFDEGRYQDALRSAQDGFQKATTNQERGLYLSMEGSVLFTMGNRDAARASWRRALTFDPTNVEVNRVLTHLDSQRAPAGKEGQ